MESSIQRPDPELMKRLHDLTNAVRTLRFLQESLVQGYRFDDELAAEKLSYAGKAVAVLERELDLLKRHLLPKDQGPSSPTPTS